jgi:hypothetical protein
VAFVRERGLHLNHPSGCEWEKSLVVKPIGACNLKFLAEVIHVFPRPKELWRNGQISSIT